MNKYEIIFIVKSTIESDAVNKTVSELTKTITDNKSKVLETKELGQKQLAYPIKKEVTGYYFVLQVEANTVAINEFEHKALINENVIRHMIIKLDEE
jgi:small subunit ribosomal protein S6